MYKLAGVLAICASPLFADGLEIDVVGEANGTIVVDLFEETAPLHVAQIKTIAAAGDYDGVFFHRVIDRFMAQTGDVQFGIAGGNLARAGMGGSNLPDIPAEFTDQPFQRGFIGMARGNNPNSANSQFFIMFEPAPHLTGGYTIVGEVVSGMDVVDAIKRGAPRDGVVTGQPDMMAAVRVTE